MFSGKETIADILEKLPEAREILAAHGLRCAGCFINTYETLEQGCTGHGFSFKEFKRLLKDLNDCANDEIQ